MDLLRRMIVLRPEEGRYPEILARLAFEASGSTRELEVLLAQPDSRGRALHDQIRLALYQSAFAEVIRLDRLRSAPSDQFWGLDPDIALACRAQGEGAAADGRLRDTAVSLRAQLAPDPDNTRLIRYLARIEAALGNKAVALGLAERAMTLTHGRGFVGANARYVLVEVCALVGEKDRAIAELKALLQIPSPANVHELRVLPVFQNLRRDPRFEALLADPKNNAPLF